MKKTQITAMQGLVVFALILLFVMCACDPFTGDYRYPESGTADVFFLVLTQLGNQVGGTIKEWVVDSDTCLAINAMWPSVGIGPVWVDGSVVGSGITFYGIKTEDSRTCEVTFVGTGLDTNGDLKMDEIDGHMEVVLDSSVIQFDEDTVFVRTN